LLWNYHIGSFVLGSLCVCVLEIWCGWVGVVSVLQAEAQQVMVIQQQSRKLLMMGILMSETC